MLSVILVSYNTEDILRKALSKVFRQKNFTDFEVIVVDNDSKDGSCAMVENEFPQVHLIRNDTNAGFAAANNLGIKVAKGEYLLLLNSDAFIFDDTLETSANFMINNPNCGIMGAQLVCEDGSPQPSAQKLPTPLQKFKIMSGISARYSSHETYHDYFLTDDPKEQELRKVGWVPGAFFLIRQSMTREIGLLDENFFMYFEEVDFCKRAHNAGWDVIFNPNIPVIHLGGASSIKTKKKVSRTGRQLMDIRINSEYYYYKKNSGKLVMFSAAALELGWKSLICLKNRLIKDKFSSVKFDETSLAVKLVWKRMIAEFPFQNTPSKLHK